MKLKVLFVNQEITPYVAENEMSTICRKLPQGIQESDREIRVFMPKFGCINERRNQLHEVIRLSGMNLVINDADYPLMIKVASIQPVRMQVYFIDNEDLFSKKFSIASRNAEEFPTADERMIFYSKGVIETIKKLGWQPDIIHCHGWFSAIFPTILKNIYAEDPLFGIKHKIIYSLYDDEFTGTLDANMKSKLIGSNVAADEIEKIENPTWMNIVKTAIDNADGVIIATNNPNPEIVKYIEDSKKPCLPYSGEENYIKDCNDFYTKIYE